MAKPMSKRAGGAIAELAYGKTTHVGDGEA
jgi:hypothetical protein